ncbi:MAG: hypothetical protein EI684_23270, partial [Candidatus Viridilinea halotolerans]
MITFAPIRGHSRIKFVGEGIILEHPGGLAPRVCSLKLKRDDLSQPAEASLPKPACRSQPAEASRPAWSVPAKLYVTPWGKPKTKGAQPGPPDQQRTLLHLQQVASAALAPAQAEVQAAIANADHVHVDETSWREGGRNEKDRRTLPVGQPLPLTMLSPMGIN